MAYTETFTGTNGAPWPAAWTLAGGTNTIQNNAGRMVTGTQAYNNAAAALGGMADSTYDIVTDLVVDNSGAENYITIMAVSDNSATGGGYNTINGFGCEYAPAYGGLSLVRTYSGSRTAIGPNMGLTLGSAIRIRVRYDGTNLSAKAWNQGSSEPTGFQITTAPDRVLSGKPSLGFSNGNDAIARTLSVDNFTATSTTESTPTATGAMGLGATASATATAQVTGASSLLLRPTATATPVVTGAVSLTVAPSAVAGPAASGAMAVGLTASAVARPQVTGAATITLTPAANAQDLSRTGAVGLGAGLSGSAMAIVTGAISMTLTTSAGATNTSYGTGAISLQPSLTATAVNLSVSGAITISLAPAGYATTFYPTPPLNPFDIKIWDVNNRYAGAITDPIYATFTPRFPGIGTAEVQVRSDSSLNAALQAPGASITVQYRKEHLFSGPISSFNGSVINGTITYQVADWWTLMKGTLAFVNPANPLTPAYQGGPAQVGANPNDTAHYWYGAASLPAETAIKRVVTDNFARLGRKVSIQADLGRGGTITPPVTRFNTLQEIVETMATSAPTPLWPRIRQVGGQGLTFELVTATTFPQVFTAQSGTLSDGVFSAQNPDATRVVLGGPGEDTDRAFLSMVDGTGLERAYGFPIEVFKDATSGSPTWPAPKPTQVTTTDSGGDTTTTTENVDYPDAKRITREYLVNPDIAAADKAAFLSALTQSGTDALADGLPTAGLQVTLSEGDGFHYGGSDGYHVGDTITVSITAQAITEQVTECSISWSTSGLTVTPTLGQQSDDPSIALYQTIAAIAAGLRRGSIRK